MDGLYLYGIVGAAEAPLPAVYGLAGGVSIVKQDGLGAIVGAPPAEGFQDLSREKALRLLMAHQQVLEAAMPEAAVLPVKFGTIAPHEAAVRTLLHQRREMLTQLLMQFAGCSQVEIIVLWQPEAIFAEIAVEPEVLEARKTAQAARDPAAAQQLGQMVKAALERRRDRLQARLQEALAPLAIDIAINAPMDDRMAVNLAVLIDQADTGPLQAALEKLDAEFGGKLTFRLVGPLPPASFATLQVSFPSGKEIDRARQILGLPGPASLDDITSAFRQRARENHPDLAGASKDAAIQIGELNAAHRLLLACAKSQKLASEGGQIAESLAFGADMGEPVLVEIVGRGGGSSNRLRSAA